MGEPKIIYGTLEQPIHTNGQYLLMEAGITNGIYKRDEFIEKIRAVPLDKVRKEECRRDVYNQRVAIESLAGLGETVTIKDFEPDRAELEEFVDTTFKEIRDRLHGKNK